MIMNLRPLVLLGLILIGFMAGTGCTLAPSPAPVTAPDSPVTVTTAAMQPLSSSTTVPASPTTTKEEMVAFVNEAVDYARQNGKEKALAEFSNRNGTFFRGELYIYAYDMNGITIAHPVNPEKIGVSRLDEKDAEGNLFIRDLRQAAVNGTGFVTYYYINPLHKNAVEKKLGYAMSVDPTWWLGSGIYQGPADTRLPPFHETTSAAGVVAPQGR